MRYYHDTMLPERAFQPLGGKMTFESDGGGGGSATPTSSTQYNTNIPEYAKPYVTNMLESTQQQLFNVDADKGITGFKPYQPYSSNMNDYFADFSPMQKQAQQATANMQVPGQFGQASGLAGMSGLGSMQAGQQYGQQATDPNAVAQYMNPYLQNTLNPAMQLLNQQYGIAGQQGQGAATKGGAFGGNRATLANSLNQQNQMLAQNQLVGGAYNQAYNTANQNMQTAAAQGLQGYGQANTAAGTLANIGGQDLAAQQSIANAQNTMGAQQTAAEQAKINQAIQNYATQQQYPMMQLGMMSNMLRGLPMQSTTTQSYQAAPNTAQQLIGAAGTLGSTYQALAKPSKEGGVIKGLAHGGSVNSYAVGGEVKQQLSMMSDDQLKQVLATSPSNEIRSMAGQILAEHKMAEQMTAAPERTTTNVGQGLMAANTGNTFDNMAGGGIIAFDKGGYTDDELAANRAATNDARPLTPEELAARMEAPVAPGLPVTPVQKPADIGSQDLNTIMRGLQQSRAEAGVTGAPRQAEKDMVEKRLAGLDAQERQQNWLKSAEFFARLGTTPGGILRGGLKAAEETMPELAKLRADQTKIRDNYTNIQANIAEADRLEKMGMVKEAEAIREKTNKEAGENSRAKDANDRALESARITAAANIRGHQITADAQLAAARARSGQERQFDKLYRINLEALVAAGGNPNDPNVKLKAANAATSSLGLAGEKLDAALLSRISTETTARLKTDPVIKKLGTDLLSAKESNVDPTSRKQTIEQINAKINARTKELRDSIEKELTNPVARPNPMANKPPAKESSIGGDKADKRPPLSNFQGS